MAERRMFTKKITESDAFLDMPMSTQALYFHLNMTADDDGFVNNPRKLQRMIGASDDDFKILIAKSFIICFESGVIVIKHWKMHNYIQSDRYRPTDYFEEKSQLELKKNKSYSLNVSSLDTECIQNVYIGKDSLGKDSLGKVNIYKADAFVSFASNNEKLLSALRDFEQMRKSIKKPMTEKAKEMLLTKLKGLSSNSTEQVEILNNSVLHCWQSVFPLDNNKENKSSYDIEKAKQEAEYSPIKYQRKSKEITND